ncbi:hypothetical protein F8A10_07750 [Paracoccus kondratievae]|uniref:Uncharacterized protein n=1 Tax=Paracoccus kondratievae TaxID=135740 RepID=A0AAD3P1E8_9RHOB|nr:hypothetical protein [Paracoccus kondratievae]QFQ87326.1 hypothetical protein F8A10_07750 [Paracoccus kondratievae]GLK65678.1 hypothetical protein GCM10017635_31550 [Paracoccus kondratievae]
MEEVFDLFGNPVDPGTGKPGRPRRVATLEERNKVKALLAVGWSNERIASVLQMSLPTFRRNFFHELKLRSVARDMLDARRLELAITAAQCGNVGAMRQVDRLLDRFDQMEAERAYASKPKEQPEPKAKLGKKVLDEVLALDADAELMKELDLETRGDVRH